MEVILHLTLPLILTVLAGVVRGLLREVVPGVCDLYPPQLLIPAGVGVGVGVAE